MIHSSDNGSSAIVLQDAIFTPQWIRKIRLMFSDISLYHTTGPDIGLLRVTHTLDASTRLHFLEQYGTSSPTTAGNFTESSKSSVPIDTIEAMAPYEKMLLTHSPADIGELGHEVGLSSFYLEELFRVLPNCVLPNEIVSSVPTKNRDLCVSMKKIDKKKFSASIKEQKSMEVSKQYEFEIDWYKLFLSSEPLRDLEPSALRPSIYKWIHGKYYN